MKIVVDVGKEYIVNPYIHIIKLSRPDLETRQPRHPSAATVSSSSVTGRTPTKQEP